MLKVPDLSGKLVLITGANSGLGLRTLIELAKVNANLILGCRDSKKGEAAKELVLKEVPNAKVNTKSIIELT